MAVTPGRPHSAEAARTIVVRAARQSDVDRIVTIEAASFGDPWSRSSFRTLVGHPHVHFAVAESDERVLGYVIVWFVTDEAEIANLAVSPEARGRGLGTLLLDTALRAAERRRAARIFLEVRDSNAHARALYASRGFVEIARRRGYYRKPVEDAVVMRRTLPAQADEA